MKGLFALMTLALVLVAMSGCAQTGGAAPQNATAEILQNQTGKASNASALDDGYKEYAQKTFSFDYPKALFADESLGSYNDGAGYAFVALQSKDENDPALLVYYIRFGNIPLLANMSAPEIAKSFLESDNTGQDMMGVLHQSSDKGNISLFTTKNGYAAAEMTYVLKDPQITQALYGYAIQVYDPATTVSMKARILATDSQKAKEARDRFIESVKIEDLPS
ncbi:MAG: hypothetical protein V1861_02205 [Candidatus Micrarchaeota archaeon]